MKVSVLREGRFLARRLKSRQLSLVGFLLVVVVLVRRHVGGDSQLNCEQFVMRIVMRLGKLF